MKINFNEAYRQNILSYLKDIKHKAGLGMAIMIELGDLETNGEANQEYEDMMNSIDDIIDQANDYLERLLPDKESEE